MAKERIVDVKKLQKVLMDGTCYLGVFEKSKDGSVSILNALDIGNKLTAKVTVDTANSYITAVNGGTTSQPVSDGAGLKFTKESLVAQEISLLNAAVERMVLAKDTALVELENDRFRKLTEKY